MPHERERVVLFLGAGFSANLGLPTTKALKQDLLHNFGRAEETRVREEFITECIKQFWRDAFGWDGGSLTPSLEDHFTQIDLAANTGHYLGPKYSPKKLRAIRRMTIHRIFKILDQPIPRALEVDGFFQDLITSTAVTVITTNWDIQVERCLQRLGTGHHYTSEAFNPQGERIQEQGIPLLKLHGSGNWGYCDCCRNLITFEIGMGKVAVHLRLLLEPSDFNLFPGGEAIAEQLQDLDLRHCILCGGRLAARVATFSYRKDAAMPVFQTIWDEAHVALRQASRWLFIGYSMPESDVEIRQLLKTAQLARMEHSVPEIHVVLKDDVDAASRFQSFFGSGLASVSQGGLSRWIQLNKNAGRAAAV